MRKILSFLVLASLFVLIFGGTIFSQELPGVFVTKTQWNGNNSEINNDMSSMPETRIITQQEIYIMNEIQRLRKTNDRNNLSRVLQLEAQLEAFNPQSITAPGIYFGGEVGKGFEQNPPFIQDVIGNTEIRNTGSKIVSGIATAIEQRGSTAGRIWAAVAWSTDNSADTIRLYRSDNDGLSWTFYGWGKLGGTDRLNGDQMDMEIIENTTGNKYIWITYGYRNNTGTGRWRTGGLIFRTPSFQGGFFGLSWPADNSTKRYYRLRITSDNAEYPSLAYMYFVASFDSTAGSLHRNTQKTARCTNPYTTSPTFSYKADKFWWHTGTSSTADLHSDIAYFQHGGNDSIIVSYSNVPATDKLFFAKSNIFNGPASASGAGGPIGGSQPNDQKQYARLSSNGNDNGSIFCVFRQNTTRWRIKYFRTTNWGNFNSMYQSALQGSTTNNSYHPDIVGVRNYPKHYFAWRHSGPPNDELRYIGVTRGGSWPQNVSRMNGQTVISGVQGPKPGFRYANNDSCFTIYSINGPRHLWAAFGCTGSITGVANNQTPVKYNLSQNYPNPFNPSTGIRFDIPKDGFVKLVVYDVLGKEVAMIVNGEKNAGSYIIDFNASSLTSGVYFYKLVTDDFVDVKKMVLVK